MRARARARVSGSTCWQEGEEEMKGGKKRVLCIDIQAYLSAQTRGGIARIDTPQLIVAALGEHLGARSRLISVEKSCPGAVSTSLSKVKARQVTVQWANTARCAIK